ncbi:MAG: ABC transporter ATP-binding protein [Chlorobiaceae bacterium]|jgi:putative ABC transport system ATP-binding protein
MGNVAIKANALVKWFGEGETKTTAVNRASFEADFGELLYIVGPSGSGKTTLLSMISGILKPNEGNVQVEGKDIWQMKSDEIADLRLHKIGFVFQDYHLFPRLTTVENVAIPLILKKMDWNKALKVALEYLDIVGLTDRAQLQPVKLSGGEQQRVAIARAIAGNPDILIFDEPTASLDGDTGRKIVEFIKTKILNTERCVIIVTHDSRIYEYADSIMKMEDGKIVGFERNTLTAL